VLAMMKMLMVMATAKEKMTTKVRQREMAR
jgi:hypothetical protein